MIKFILIMKDSKTGITLCLSNQNYQKNESWSKIWKSFHQIVVMSKFTFPIIKVNSNVNKRSHFYSFTFSRIFEIRTVKIFDEEYKMKRNYTILSSKIWFNFAYLPACSVPLCSLLKCFTGNAFQKIILRMW